MAYPRDLAANEIPATLAALVRTLADRILNGHTSQHRILREQLAAATLSRITLTGAGLYAYFEHSQLTPLVSPAEMIGGEVMMTVHGLDAPAGSLVAVNGGRLDFVEIYTFGDVGWPDEPNVIQFDEATHLPIPVKAT